MLSLLALLPLALFHSANAATLARRDTNVHIQSGRDGKCLDVPQPFHFSGTPVVSASCDEAATWSIDHGSGSIILGGFGGSFALDAGSNPHNNGALKVWQSYPGLFQQTWYWTPDNRIAITGGDQCLDEGDNGVQTYKCTTGNTNQVWNIIPATSTSTTTSSTSTATGTPAAIPSGTVYPDPAGGGGRRIHWNGRADLCVTILAEDLERDPADGTPVGIAYCLPLDSPNVRMQLWDLPCPGGTQQLNLHGGGTCLTAGATDDGLLPSDGTPITVRECHNEPVQVWTFESDAFQFCLGNGDGQCLNVVKDSQPGNQSPIQSLRNLQTWRAGPSDPQTNFFLSPLSPGPHSQC